MQIFLKSHTECSLGGKCPRARRARGFTQPAKLAGFTLVELLVSIAIIGLVTGIVLVKYKSFDSSVLLKDTAYEIALAIREAQIKSVSAMRNTTDNYDYPYGVYFNINGATNQKRYIAFRYTGALATPRYVAADLLSTILIGRSMQVVDLCVKRTGFTGDDCGIIRLDVSFRRPEFKSLFFASTGSTNYTTTITEGKIIVGSTSGEGDRYAVIVSALGQITVDLCDDTLCPP